MASTSSLPAEERQLILVALATEENLSHAAHRDGILDACVDLLGSTVPPALQSAAVRILMQMRPESVLRDWEEEEEDLGRPCTLPELEPPL